MPPPYLLLRVMLRSLACELTWCCTFRVRTLLRFAYAHVQMMLYRPFLHYISPRLATDRTVDERYYACAAAGISVSRNILHIAMEIKNQALVVGPFWSMLYTEFFAILTLVFYVVENPDKQGSAEIFADAKAGREMIIRMAGRSLAAGRISESLDTLWEKLPDSIENSKSRPLASRKRSAPGMKPGSLPSAAHKATVSSAKIPARKPLNPGNSFKDLHRASSQRTVPMSYSNPHQSLDIPSTASENGTTPTTAHCTSHTQQSPSIYKLDALMFPSGDPLAYPNQPLADFSTHMTTLTEPQSSHVANAHRQHSTDSRNYYIPGIYGDLERQLSKSCDFINIFKKPTLTVRQ